MPISWNEIKQNAIAFSKEWATESREEAEAKTFWDEFFKVFGLKRRTVASFEEPVKNLSGHYGYIDLFWKGTLLAEHKSRGKPLDKAHSQAMEYIQNLQDEGREKEIPRYIAVSDFAKIALHDLDENNSFEIPLSKLHLHVDKFAFIPGYKQHKLEDQDPINIKAVELLGDLHDSLEDGGYSGHELERFLVRILFCLFAEDTGLFERNVFTNYIDNHTAEDGSDLGAHLAKLFVILNTPEAKRQKNLIEELKDLPYVNGDLFAETLGFADFNRQMRDELITCCRFDWSRISPAIFGSLFQSIMQKRERRQIGAHYTSERDILKLVRSLFLDDLRAEFESLKAHKGTQRKARLEEFHDKLGKLTFLDPACGCGNFLVVTYRELRLLEIEVLKLLHERVIHIELLSKIDVDAMYGIEINEFPAQIAQVAMWLIDHQMNQKLSEAFGQYLARLPLKKTATIRNANALRIDWNEVLPAARCSYVLGNPPFVGKHLLTKEQQEDTQVIWGNVKGSGLLDYVTCWYKKAAQYTQGRSIPIAFVSTNSITQGEQVGILWSDLFVQHHVKIHFAYRTFSWESEAKGKAHVHVVIIGFGDFDKKTKYILQVSNKSGDVTVETAANIGPYLINSTDVALPSRRKPLCAVPSIVYGNKPSDGGFLIVEDCDKATFLSENPEVEPWLKPFVSADEFINGRFRWVLWLIDAPPAILRMCPGVVDRLNQVRLFREKSIKLPTRKKAATPSLFAEIRQPSSRYLLIPRHSSENRKYIPFGYFEPSTIIADSCTAIPDATHFHFGVLSSDMHMSWVRLVCGRIKSDFRYSNSLVYNNFPWPQSPTEKQKATVEEHAQAVLDARAQFPDSSLADLYDPLTMPPALQKAHAELDRAVELCYRKEPFHSDRERVEYLFALYEKLSTPLTAGMDKPKRGRKKKAETE